MKQYQEPKIHICRFCKQGFLNGRQLGGHMRRHLALIAAIKQQNHQENGNVEMGFDQIVKKIEGKKQSIQENDGGGDDVMVNKSQRSVGVDQDFDKGKLGNDETEMGFDQIVKKIEGGKQSIQENDDGDDVMVNKSQLVVGVDQDFDKGKLGNGETEMGFGFLDDQDENDQIIKKIEGGKHSIQENDDGGDDVMVNKSQRAVGVDQVFDKGEMGFVVLDDQDNGDQMIKKIEGGKQSIQENDGGGGDDVMVKKSQRIVGVGQDFEKGKFGNNVYVLRENPKKSWRVSNGNEILSKDYVCKKRCDSRKELVKECVCDKCGKSFGSLKALYGHMRCHSVKKSRPLDQDEDVDDELANPVRKKRSCARYKSPKPSHYCDSLSSCCDEVEYGAICLMMLSRGVRDLDEVKMVISQEGSNVEFEVSVDGLMSNKSKVGFKKDLGFKSGSGRVGSTKPRSWDQDFGDMDVADFEISFELERRSKGHYCPICLKGFGSGRALGRHKKVHNSHIPDAHTLVKPDFEFLREVSTMVLWGP